MTDPIKGHVSIALGENLKAAAEKFAREQPVPTTLAHLIRTALTIHITPTKKGPK
jgi:hypothetical protein